MAKRKRSIDQSNNKSQDATQRDETGEETGQRTSPTSTISSKRVAVGVGTIVDNIPQPGVVLTNNSSSPCLTRTTIHGTQMYDNRKSTYAKVIHDFMKRNMGLMPFCCEDEDAIQIIDMALKKELVVCPAEMSSIDFKLRLMKLCISANKSLRTRAQSSMKGVFTST